MDSAQVTFVYPSPLYGVASTLRRLYSPQFEIEAPIAAALLAIDRNEQIARMQVASLAQARQPSLAGA